MTLILVANCSQAARWYWHKSAKVDRGVLTPTSAINVRLSRPGKALLAYIGAAPIKCSASVPNSRFQIRVPKVQEMFEFWYYLWVLHGLDEGGGRMETHPASPMVCGELDHGQG